MNAKVLPTESALEGILLGLGLSRGDAEYQDWFEARRVLHAGLLRQKMLSRTAVFSGTHRARRIRRVRGPVSRRASGQA